MKFLSQKCTQCKFFKSYRDFYYDDEEPINQGFCQFSEKDKHVDYTTEICDNFFKIKD